jgi:hypothetical protein
MSEQRSQVDTWRIERYRLQKLLFDLARDMERACDEAARHAIANDLVAARRARLAARRYASQHERVTWRIRELSELVDDAQTHGNPAEAGSPNPYP